jgi:chromosome partitioning protein
MGENVMSANALTNSHTNVIALVNQKGGVSKTVSSLNIAYALANYYGKKVLLIDFDSQASSTLDLGVDATSEDTKSIDELLDPYVQNIQRRPAWDQIKPYIITPTYTTRERDDRNRMKWVDVSRPYGFDLMPSSINLSVTELRMGIASVNKQIYSGYLNDIIQTINENDPYDFIVIDTPPALGALSVNAIRAATAGCIAPTNLDIMSFYGLQSLISTIESVRDSLAEGEHAGIMGILLNLYSERRTIDRALDDYLKNFYPVHAFATRIPESSDVKKANASNLLYAQVNKKAAQAYKDLAAEIIYFTEHGILKWVQDEQSKGVNK